jgi:hypothetical protein
MVAGRMDIEAMDLVALPVDVCPPFAEDPEQGVKLPRSSASILATA